MLLPTGINSKLALSKQQAPQVTGQASRTAAESVHFLPRIFSVLPINSQSLPSLFRYKKSGSSKHAPDGAAEAKSVGVLDGILVGDKETVGDSDGDIDGSNEMVGDVVGDGVGNAGVLHVPQAKGHISDTKVPSYTSIHGSEVCRKPCLVIQAQSRFFFFEPVGIKMKEVES